MNGIYSQAPEVKRIAMAAFPDYKGRTFRVETFSGPMRLDSNWEGGSRSYYVILDLVSLRHATIPENGTPFSNGGKIERITELPLNCAVVEHCLFCGKDLGIRIYVSEANLTKMLPAPVELTRDQKIVLVATRSLKSFARFEEARSWTGIGKLAYDQAKAELIARGLLKSNGAITDEGRNAAGSTQLHSLAPEHNQTVAENTERTVAMSLASE